MSVAATNAYDQLKVQAVLNEIDGKTSDGNRSAPVPAIFGMNFQSVSVGQKLVDPVKSCVSNTTATCDPTYFAGGYEPVTLKFTPQMAQAIAYVDGALGSMADELQKEGLMGSTEFIISAKHGQSPIDPMKLHKIGGDPLKNNRTPDVIVQPIPGTIYTKSAAKVAEHGGFSEDDTHVAMLVVNGTVREDERRGAESDSRVVKTRVFTRQIAPSILQFLGLNPNALKSVRIEETPPLPR